MKVGTVKSLKATVNRPPTHIHIHPRYIRMFTDPGVEMRETNYRYRKLDWRLPLSETALVCFDVWSRPITFAQDTCDRNERIVRRRLVPLLAAARRAGMTVIHAPAYPLAQRHPNWVGRTCSRPPGAVPPPAPAPDWPPCDFRKKRGVYAQYARPPEPQAERQGYECEHQRDFHPAVKPVGDEPVIHDGRELHGLCAQRGILHLIYAGFYANACLITRNYAPWPMVYGYGYHAILVRDCTTGMENHATHKGLICTRGIIATLEQFDVYTVSSGELRKALMSAHKEGRARPALRHAVSG